MGHFLAYNLSPSLATYLPPWLFFPSFVFFILWCASFMISLFALGFLVIVHHIHLILPLPARFKLSILPRWFQPLYLYLSHFHFVWISFYLRLFFLEGRILHVLVNSTCEKSIVKDLVQATHGPTLLTYRRLINMLPSIKKLRIEKRLLYSHLGV
jgi:hypothetical protein